MAAEAEKRHRTLRTLPRRYFARRVIYPAELPTIMRKHIVTGVMGSLYFGLITGVFFIYFANRVGMTNFQWGLMGTGASLMLMLQVFAVPLTQHYRRRKVLWFWFAIANRSSRITGIVLALLLWYFDMPGASVVLIVAVGLANLFGAMAYPPWMGWLADIIPERVQGGFWGRRSSWIAASSILVMLPLSLLMDSIGSTHKLAVSVVIFAGAAVLGFMDIFIHGTIPEPRMEMPEPGPFLPQLFVPLKDKGYRPWLLFNAAWTFSMTLGGSLCTIYIMRDLHMQDYFLGLVIVLNGLGLMGSWMAAPRSGRLVDKFGPKRVLLWGHVFWAMLPIPWLVATQETALWWVALSSLVGGAASTAAVNAATKLVTRYPSPEQQPMYVAVSSAVGSLTGAAGVFVAGSVLKVFEDWQAVVLGHTLGAFHLLFIGSFCLRMLSATLLIRRINDPVPEKA